jgi:hypothetical protein
MMVKAGPKDMPYQALALFGGAEMLVAHSRATRRNSGIWCYPEALIGVFIAERLSITHIAPRQFSLLGLVVFLITFFLSADRLRGETYRSDRFGYSVSLPYGWVRVPANVLQEAITHAAPAGKSGFETEVAFQRRSDPWFEGPYAVMMVFPTGSQVSEDRIDETVKMITGIQPEHFEASINAELRPLMDVRSSRVRLDKTRRRYLWELDTQVGGEPWILRTYGFFGRRSLVHLCFYDRRGQPSADADAQLASSFQFDVASAYERTSVSNQPKWAQYVATALGLAIASCIAAFWRKVFRKRNGPVERPPAPPVEREPGRAGR